MAIHVALNHVTHYRYDRRVALSPQVVRLRPAPHCRTPILSYSLRVEPAGHFENWQQDPFANYLARLVFPERTAEFKVTVDLVAEMAVYNPFDFFLEPEAENFPFAYAGGLAHDLAPYLAAKDVGLDSAARPEFAGTLLNVIASPDGWAYVVMGRRGYESFGVSVWKYSSAGPLDTGIAYSYGC